MVQGVTSEFCLNLFADGHIKRVLLKHAQMSKAKKLWIHLDEDNEESIEWLKEKSGVSDIVIENLLDEETLPRYFTLPTGTFVVLRDMNLNRNADIEDMIGIRLWIENDRLISLSHRRQPAVEKLVNTLTKDKIPTSPMGIFVRLSSNITENILRILMKIDDALDDFEDEVIDVDRSKADKLRAKVSDIRHQILGMRRYIGPQKEVFSNLKILDDLSKEEKAIFRSIRRDMVQAVSSLDYAREHSSVSQEELNSSISFQISQTMYFISIITVLFMPLTLIASILGANVGGIPGSTHPAAFWVLNGFLGLVCILQIFWLKWKKWF